MQETGLILLGRAVDAMKAGRLTDARALLNESIWIESSLVDSTEYLFVSGVLNSQTGHIEAGKGQIAEAARREPRNAAIAKKLGELLLQLGDVKGAGRHLLRANRIEALKGREDVFVFGDSHSEFCFGGVLRCKVNWLGPITMHRVGRDGLAFLDLRAYKMPEKAVAVLIFGEIDVRTHVLRQVDQHGRALEEVLRTLTENYLRTVLLNRAACPNVDILIASVMPPTSFQNDPALPFYGKLTDRAAATERLNEILRDACRREGLKYLDLYKYFRESGGSLNRFYADSSVHVRKEFHDIIEYELTTVAGLL